MHFRSAPGISDILQMTLVVKDDEEKTDETSGSLRTTSTESEIDTVCLQSSHPEEHPKTDGCLSPPTTEPTSSPFSRPISPSVALSYDPVKQAISEGDCRAIATTHPPHAITVCLHRHKRQQGDKDMAHQIQRVYGHHGRLLRFLRESNKRQDQEGCRQSPQDGRGPKPEMQRAWYHAED